MAVLLPGKFLFLATPYTGSVAVANALKKLPGAVNVQAKSRGIGHHATLEQVREVDGSRITGTERVFAFVRNPYDLIVTWYLREKERSNMRALEKSLKRIPTFCDFVEAWAEHQPEGYLQGGRIFYHASDAKHVLRYERGLGREVNLLLRKLEGVPDVQIQRENPTPHKDHWSLYYDGKSYKAANLAFQRDFVEYGYPFLWR